MLMGLIFSATNSDFGLEPMDTTTYESVTYNGDCWTEEGYNGGGELHHHSVYADPPEEHEVSFEIDYSEGNEVFVETFKQTAQSLVPVDTGFLMSSIDGTADANTIQCVASTPYAQYVEYGTWKMAAQPYFEPALEAAYAAAMPVWAMAREQAKFNCLQENLPNTAVAGAGDEVCSGLNYYGMPLDEAVEMHCVQHINLMSMLLMILVAAILELAKTFVEDTLGTDFGSSLSSFIQITDGE